MTLCRQATGQRARLPPLQSTVSGFGGPGSQGFLPLAECTALLGTDFRQEKKSIKVHKASACTSRSRPGLEDLKRGSQQGPCSPILFLALLAHRPCGSPVSAGAQTSDPATFALRSLQALPLAGARPPRAPKCPGPAFPGLDDGDIAWATSGCGNSFSVGKPGKNPGLQSASPGHQNPLAAGQVWVPGLPESAAALTVEAAILRRT